MVAQVASGRPVRVLVSEDDGAMADTTKLLLEVFGCEVTVAYSGTTGVAKAQQTHPDVVISDLGLPGLDGFGIARALRHNTSTSDARLIAVSAYGSPEDKRRAREAGFELHITKPADPKELVRVLASFGPAGR
jgi:CheY-like chemotaxis protein